METHAKQIYWKQKNAISILVQNGRNGRLGPNVPDHAEVEHERRFGNVFCPRLPGTKQHVLEIQRSMKIVLSHLVLHWHLGQIGQGVPSPAEVVLSDEFVIASSPDLVPMTILVSSPWKKSDLAMKRPVQLGLNGQSGQNAVCPVVVARRLKSENVSMPLTVPSMHRRATAEIAMRLKIVTLIHVQHLPLGLNGLNVPLLVEVERDREQENVSHQLWGMEDW